MNVIVSGSRNWDRYDLIHAELVQLPRGSTIMHGGARGADLMAATIASSLGFDVVEYPALWKWQGRSAGVRRNLLMLDDDPDLVLAFQRDGSRGTQHMIDQARKRGVPLKVVSA